MFSIGLLLASEADEFSRCFRRYEKPIGLKFMKLDYLTDDKAIPNANLMTAKQIRRAIKPLTQLTALDLQLNNVEVPTRLVNLRELSTLYPIRESRLPNLSNLTRLKIPKVVLLQHFEKGLSKLESLEFDGFSFKSSGCKPNTTLTELRISTLDNNFFESLQNLRKLEIITKYVNPYIHNAVTINEHFTRLKELRCENIDLPNNYSSALESLESCLVHETSTNAKILSHLDWKKITRLETTATEENYYFFAKFTNLADLDLTLAPKLPQNEPYSAPLTRLTRLNMLYNFYPTYWMTGLPNLVELSIAKIPIGWEASPSWKITETIDFQALKNLTSIRIKGNYTCINVWKLTNLMHLEIQGISRSYPLEIHGLSTLKNLTSLVFQLISPRRYRYNALKNWCDLMPLTKLRELHVHTEKNTGDVTKLVALQNLTYLDISVKSPLVKCLTQLSKLQKLHIETLPEIPINNKLFLKALPFCYSFEISVKNTSVK